MGTIGLGRGRQRGGRERVEVRVDMNSAQYMYGNVTVKPTNFYS
jgi:hypothetical protein